MSGSPLLRAAIVLAVLLSLLVPLRSFTAAREPVTVPPAAAETARESIVHLEIVSTKAPFAFEVKHLGEVVWKGDSLGESAEGDVKLPIPKEGIDLSVQVDWRVAGMAAARLTVSYGNDSFERSLWGDGSVEDVLTFP